MGSRCLLWVVDAFYIWAVDAFYMGVFLFKVDYISGHVAFFGGPHVSLLQSWRFKLLLTEAYFMCSKQAQ